VSKTRTKPCSLNKYPTHYSLNVAGLPASLFHYIESTDKKFIRGFVTSKIKKTRYKINSSRFINS